MAPERARSMAPLSTLIDATPGGAKAAQRAADAVGAYVVGKTLATVEARGWGTDAAEWLGAFGRIPHSVSRSANMLACYTSYPGGVARAIRISHMLAKAPERLRADGRHGALMRDSIVHELSHFAADMIYGNAQLVGHGATWQALAKAMGCNPQPVQTAAIIGELRKATLPAILECVRCGGTYHGTRRRKRGGVWIHRGGCDGFYVHPSEVATCRRARGDGLSTK